ncbi:MAG: hypothetical protein PWP46_2056 [Fusobacteriaceae bacterium]|jgi:DNA-binding response OmpR family regulator|nr:DNA-binding response regulator [Fusobacteriales bacterium]MDN5305170.1 hypothetical protein [Fusobacteriaceae bacterium]
MRLVIIEDDEEIRELVKYAIKDLKINIFEADNGKKGLELIEVKKPQLIILDVGLPDIEGWDICKSIRENNSKYENPAIIMLTAKEDVIKGFEIGADEYIVKPFDEKELFYRIKRFTNRFIKDEEVVEYGDIQLYTKKMELYLNKERIKLGKKELELLEYFILNRGILLSREALLNKIWENDWEVGDRAVDQCIKRLRAKLPILKENLVTKRGFGYILKKIR